MKITINETRLRQTIKHGLLKEYYYRPSWDPEEIDDINYEITTLPDNDDITQALQDEFGVDQITNRQQDNFVRCFITGNTEYSLECGTHDDHGNFFDGTYKDIEDLFGTGIANAIVSDFNAAVAGLSTSQLNEQGLELIRKKGRGNLYDILSGEYDETPFDKNNPETVNNVLKNKFKNCKDQVSFYLLPDGDTVGMPDHCYVSEVGHTKASYMNLGNIRVGHGSLGIMKEPTRQQLSMIRQLCGRYENRPLEVHLCTYHPGDAEPSSDHIVTYYNPASQVASRRVSNDIINYYREGVKPTDKNFDYDHEF